MRAHLAPLVLLLAASGSAQTVLLRYRPPVGRTASYTMVTAMSMTNPMGGAGGTMRFTQTTPLVIRVLSRTGAATTVETRMGPMRFDAPAGSPMAAMGRNPALKKPIVTRMTIGELGALQGASGGPTVSAMSNDITSALGQGSGNVAFPKGPVKVGDTWSSVIDLGKKGAGASGVRMSGKIPVTYRLVALKGGVATIAMVAKGTMAMKVAARPMSLAMDVRSTVLVDAATGLTKSMSTTSDTVTTLPGMGAMRQHMTATLR